MIFAEQAEIFIRQAQTRKRNPIKARTVAIYRSYLDSQILSFLGQKPLTEIENGTLKTFVQHLSGAGLSSATITGIVSVVKQVVSSAVDANGNELYPRHWNNEFIDLPIIDPRSQDAPTVAPVAVETALGRAKGPDKALYALLAGSGLRIGEALALMVGPDDGKNSFWVPDQALCVIRTTLVDGEIQDSTKTLAGTRQVDLTPELNSYLCQLLLDSELPRYGLLFTSKTGGPMRVKTAYEHLREAGIPDGFHAFRRFRLTYLDGAGVPRGLLKFWAGHAAKDVTERYIRSGEGIKERRTWAQKAGLGFQLEA